MSTQANQGETIRFGEGTAPEETARFGEGTPPEAAAGATPPPPPEDAGAGEGGSPQAGEEPARESEAEEPKKNTRKKKKKKKKSREAPAEGGEGEEGGKGKGKKLRLLALILLIVASVAVLTFASVAIILRLWGPSGPSADPPVQTTAPPESEAPVEPSPTPTPETTPTPVPTASTSYQDMTLNEAVDYVKGLKPSDLGLDGTSMADYEVYPGERVVLVGGRSCMEIRVYSDQNPTGANEIRGRYFITRAAPFKLYRLDSETQEMHELALSGSAQSASAPGS